LTTVGLAGVTAIDCSVGAGTVNTVDPTTDPEVALIVLVPAAKADANPPAVIVAVAVVAEAHVTEAVRFCVLLSLYVPVAVNCCVDPLATDGFAGVTAMDCSDATVSVSVALPVPAMLVALTVTAEVPAAVGVPEINPVALLTVNPAGNPVAP
jgi:hypothetical protein